MSKGIFKIYSRLLLFIALACITLECLLAYDLLYKGNLNMQIIMLIFLVGMVCLILRRLLIIYYDGFRIKRRLKNRRLYHESRVQRNINR